MFSRCNDYDCGWNWGQDGHIMAKSQRASQRAHQDTHKVHSACGSQATEEPPLAEE